MLSYYVEPGYYDSGLVEDHGAVVNNYLKYITSNHHDRPNFAAMILALTQPAVDLIESTVIANYNYDLDVATGVQLDAIGKWIGISRNIAVPVAGVFFAFDTAGVGFDQGTWFGPGNSATGVTVLDDVSYRTLLRAKIGANHWDGTANSLLGILRDAFVGTTASFAVEDTQDMAMNIKYTSAGLSSVQIALLTGNYLIPKPAGVKVNYISM